LEKPKCKDIYQLLDTLIFIQDTGEIPEKCYNCSAFMEEKDGCYCALALMKLPSDVLALKGDAK